MARRMLRKFEYRIVWRHTNRKCQRSVITQTSPKVLRELLKLTTAEPWRGMTFAQLRKSWLRYSLQMDLPWESVEAMPLREVACKLRDVYGPLDFIRIEFREVGDWTQMLDPIQKLIESPACQRAMLKQDALVLSVEAMDKHTLNAWRMLPRIPETGAKVRQPYRR